MTIRRIVGSLLLAAAWTGLAYDARALNTDGTVTVTVTTVNYSGNYAPRNVAVVWVVDGNGKFVKTLCRHANARIGYLYKWIASRGSYTGVDGITSATLTTQPQTHTVTWDCRNTNGAVVADGLYYFRAEYTSINGQGPFLSNACALVKGPTALSTNYPNTSNAGGQFTGLSLTYRPAADVGVTLLSPASGLVDSNIAIRVTATNLTLNPATFTVAISNMTVGTLIGLKTVTALAGRAGTNLTFAWNTAGLAATTYSIRAVASILASETATTNNVLAGTITLSEVTADDIAVAALSPSVGILDALVPFTVAVTNAMPAATGPFPVSLAGPGDTVGSALIDTRQVGGLAGRAGTNVLLFWNTAGLTAGVYQVSALAGPLAGETHTADNALTNAITLRQALHDLAVLWLVAPPMAPPNALVNVSVAITNSGDVAESFSHTLRDITASPIAIGTRAVSNLAAHAMTNLVYTWNTATNAGFAQGYHTLQAVATVVAGETNTADNTNQLQVIVASGMITNTLVSKTAVWKYLAKGLDINAAPWQLSDYYDGFWDSGAAPLGYNLPNIATTIGYGGISSNRYVTSYFRREFTMDFLPTTIVGRVLRAHGVVVSVNGTEIARQNMPPGPVAYTTLASNTVSGAAATNYFGFTVPASALTVGRNLIIAELHLAAVTNTAAGFALELTTVQPAIPLAPSVAATAIHPEGVVQSGDLLGLFVELLNNGNTATSCLVLLRDAATGEVLAQQTVNTLVPGESVLVRLSWPTLGAATGTRLVQAVTVIDGITNLTDLVTAPVTLDAPNFTARSVNADGSIGGRCNAVAVDGRHVYLGCGATLEAWDAVVPSSPARVGAVRLPGVIEDLAVSNHWVYAATGAAGVQIVDAASPTQLLHRTTFDTSGFARRVACRGDRLYVADALGGVRVLQVASPAAPTLVGAYQTVGPAQTVTVTWPYLLALDEQRGLQILDAAHPAAMTLVGAYSPRSAGLALVPVTGAALVADANGGLARIDTAAPAAPALVRSVLLPSVGHGLAVSASEEALYVAAGAAGVLSMDAATLELQDTAAVGGQAADVAVAGNTLYVAAGFAGARSLDISSPFSPQPLAVYATGARPVDAVAVGSTLYVAADESGLQVHSLKDPALPTLQHVNLTASNSRCIEVSYPLAYVGDGIHGLKIFNIAGSGTPTPVGSHPAEGLSLIRHMALSGTRLALTDGRRIQLLSVANPAAPVLLATVTNAPGRFIFDMAAFGDHLYAACGNAGLRIYGLDNGLTLEGAYATPGPATGVASVSDVLHVACGAGGWLALSVAADPINPALIKATVPGVTMGVAAAGSLVYLSDGARKGEAFNTSAPLTPTSVAGFSNLAQALHIRAARGLVLALEDEAGLAILNASPGDINLSGIPDAWEQQIVNASAATNGPIRSVLDVDPLAVGPNGFPYYQSYMAGLSPADPESVLAIRAVSAVPPDGQFVIQWPSVPGIKYVVHKSTNLTEPGGGFLPVSPVIVATSTTTAFTNAVSTRSAFYMIVVVP